MSMIWTGIRRKDGEDTGIFAVSSYVDAYWEECNSFDRRLFPIPSDSIGEIKNKGWAPRPVPCLLFPIITLSIGLAVTVNLHDADGVRPTEIVSGWNSAIYDPI